MIIKRLLVFFLISLMLVFSAKNSNAGIAAPGKQGEEILVEEDEDVYMDSIGLNPHQMTLNQKCLDILSEAKSIHASGGELGDVFKKMGQKKVGFKDLIAFKADYQNNETSRLVEEGMSGEEATAKAVEKWNTEYRIIEQQMVSRRQQMVKLVWSAALGEYLKNNPDSTLLAKGDIGGWATETIEKMRFESDIDFTLFSVEAEHAIELRDLFEKKLKQVFGLDMRQFDAFCTAQRNAANDVYIGEWGAKWGEIDMAARGKAQMFVIKDDGSIAIKEVPAKDMLKIYHKKRGSFSDDVFNPTADMEPGISLEMLRHIRAEIFAGKFSTIERMIKMCKYLNRSTKDHKTLLGDSATTKNKKLAKFALEVTEAKQNSKNLDETINKIFTLADDYLGKSWAGDPVKALNELAKRCDHEIRHNISEAVEFHRKRINDIEDPAQKAREHEWMKDVLDKEKSAYDHDKLTFPDDAQKMLDQYKGASEAYKLFGEKPIEYMKFMSEKAASTKMAMAYLLNRADQNIDKVNNFLDYLDNKTIEKIRSSDISIKVVKGQKTLHSVSIKSINQSLNDSVLGKIGNNTAFKGFNLGQEAYAYYDAYANAPNGEEAFKNIAVEVFRRRVPGGGMAEAVIMENYTRAGIEVAYMIFPPLAIPEAIYTLGSQITEAGVKYYWGNELDNLTEEIYVYSSFKPVEGSKGAKWKLTALRDSSGYKYKSLQQYILQDEHVNAIFYKAVATDPVLKQLETLINHPSVGEGTKYGKKMKLKYDERELEASKDLLKKLIESLEERMAAEALGQGIGKKRMEEIREELQCGTEPLVPESGEVEVDGDMYRQAMLDFKVHTDAVEEINKLSDKVGTKFGYHKPICSLDSLQMGAKTNPKLVSRYKQMISDVEGELKKIRGSFNWSDEKDKKDMKDLMEYRKLAEPDLSNEYDLWKEKYEETLKKIKNRYTATVEDIVILPKDDDVFEGEEVSLEAKFGLKEKENVTYHWTVTGVEYKDFSGEGKEKAKLTPTTGGTLSVKFEIKRNDKVIGERKESIEIYPVTLEEIAIEIEGKDYLGEDNTTVQLKATSDYSDGSYADITEDVSWEVTSGENIEVSQKGQVTLTETETYTPDENAAVTVKGAYEDKSAEINISLKLELKDLGSYWETDPKYPEIPVDSDPHGVWVAFKAITDDPKNNDKRTFKWTFETAEGEVEAVGFEVEQFYTELGVYGVLLTVTDEWGNIDEEHETISIEQEYLDEEDVPEAEEAEIILEEEKKFETPEGYKNTYKGKMTSAKGLTVLRYDWKTPLNKKAGFVESEFWNYSNVGYFNESTCLKTGPIESGTVFNPGFLVYYNSTDKSVHYAVLGTGQETIHTSAFVKEKPNYSHHGVISESRSNVVPESIMITEVLSRSFRISWKDTEGNKHTAIIWKYSDNGGYTYEGMEAGDKTSLAANEVAKEMQDMLTEEENKSIGDEELAMMVEEEIQKMLEEESKISKQKPVSVQKEPKKKEPKKKEPKKVDKKELKKRVKAKIKEKWAETNDQTIQTYKHYRPDGSLSYVSTYYVSAVSTVPVSYMEALTYISSKYPEAEGVFPKGKKLGLLDLLAALPNANNLMDTWEIMVTHGPMKHYSEGGTHFEGDDPFTHGRRTGVFWLDSGGIWERGQWVNGLKQGAVTLHDNYKDSKVVGRGAYRNDQRHGTWSYNGLNGSWTTEYENGSISIPISKY